jgi:hypothetical protein
MAGLNSSLEPFLQFCMNEKAVERRFEKESKQKRLQIDCQPAPATSTGGDDSVVDCLH